MFVQQICQLGSVWLILFCFCIWLKRYLHLQNFSKILQSYDTKIVTRKSVIIILPTIYSVLFIGKYKYNNLKVLTVVPEISYWLFSCVAYIFLRIFWCYNSIYIEHFLLQWCRTPAYYPFAGDRSRTGSQYYFNIDTQQRPGLSFDAPQKYFARYFYFARGVDLFVFGTYKLNRTLYENLSCRRRVRFTN